jgi:hypothetical protein
MGALAAGLLAILAAGTACAQPADTSAVPEPPPAGGETGRDFIFSGSASVYGQHANRQGSYQQTPADFVRTELAPTFSFYNVPFTVNVLLSTEQSSVRQNINSISLDFNYHKLEGMLMERAYNKVSEIEELKQLSDAAGDVDRLRDSLATLGEEKLRDLDRLKDYADIEKLKDQALSQSLDKLDELGLVSASEKFFANFPAFGVGVTYPNYSQLTLDQVPVTGGNIEWNPGKFYIALAGGKTQRAISVPSSTLFTDSVVADPAYTRTLFAGRIGYGKKDGGHVILTGLYAKDDESSLPIDSAGAPLRPRSNYVLGIDATIPIVEDYVLVQGEAAGSMLTGDISAADINQNDIPDWIRKTFDPNISSLLDYAFMIRATIRVPESDTRITGSYRQVGPVFFSLGVPALRNDNLRWDARVEQKFDQRRITATLFARRDADGIVPNFKTAPSSVQSYGVGLGLNFPHYPYLRVEYSPYQQHYTSGDLAIENTTSLLSATSGYYYRIGSLNASTTLIYSSQNSSTYLGLSDYGVSTITASQSLAFDIPLALGASLSTSQLRAAGDTSTRILSLDLSGSYTAFNIWSSSAGFTLADQGDAGNNVGFFVGSSIAIDRYGVFELRAEKNVYRNLLQNLSNFNEFLLTASFTSTW